MEGKIKSERKKVKNDEDGSHGNPSQHCSPSWTGSTDRAWRPQSILQSFHILAFAHSPPSSQGEIHQLVCQPNTLQSAQKFHLEKKLSTAWEAEPTFVKHVKILTLPRLT